MGLKKLLIPLLVLLIASQAFAAVTTTINSPDGDIFFPVTQNQRFMDINFTVVDNNAAASIHTVTIQFGTNDTNTVITTDQNIGVNECKFQTAETWTTPGADCIIRYTFPRTGTIIATGTYVLDANVASVTSQGEVTADGVGVTTFGMDNRLVSPSVLAILVLSTLILAAMLIFFLISFLGGSLDAETMVLLAVVGIGAIIGIILVSEFLTLLTP